MPEYSKQLTSWVRYDLDTCVYIYTLHIFMLRIALVLEVALVEHKHMTLIHPWLSQLHPRKKTWGTWFSQTTKHGGSCLLLTHVVMRNTDLYKSYIAIYIYNRKITRRKFVMSQQVLVAAVWNRGTYQKIPAIWAINRWWGKSTE